MQSDNLKLKTIFIIVIFFAVFLLPKISSATIFISENWDTGTPPAGWPCKNFPANCASLTFNGWYAGTWYCSQGWGTDCGLDANTYHTAPYSFKMSRLANQSDACPIMKDIPEPHPAKVYIRMYLYFPNTEWGAWDHSAVAGDANEHFMFLNSAIAGGGRAVIDIKDYESQSPWPPYCWVNVPNQAYFFGFGGADGQTDFGRATVDDCYRLDLNTDKWISFEWMFDTANDKYALWRDGVQVVGTGGNGVDQEMGAQTDWFRLILDMFRSGNIDDSAKVYIDDIVVSDSYIGPMGVPPDTTPPQAPTGVTVS